MNAKALLVTAMIALSPMLVPPARAQGQPAVRVVNEGGIRDEWTLAPGTRLPAPGYPAAYADSAETVCLAVGYRIRPDGTTGDFTVLKAWNSAAGEREPGPGFWDAFSRASVAALSQWRFQPRPEISTPRPVDTVATMTFAGRDAGDPAALRARCAIRNLADLLEQMKAIQNRRGDMNLHDLERVRQLEQERQEREAMRRANQRVD